MLELLITTFVAGLVGASTALLVERYRSRLQNMSRYHEVQLTIYSELWSSLYDLKLVADSLWDVATVSNLGNFVEQLQKTDDTINRNILLVEDGHEAELKGLIQAFWNFHVGKEKLIKVHKKRDAYGRIDNRMIKELIGGNRQTKKQYDQLLKKIKRSFRSQLKTPW